LFLSQLLIDSCLDSSKKDSTEDFAGDGQECDSSPIVKDLEVAFLRDLYNESFVPVTWDSLFLLLLAQDFGSFFDIGLLDGILFVGSIVVSLL